MRRKSLRRSEAAVEGGCIACPFGLGQRGERGFPEAAPRSAVEAGVDRGTRAVGDRAIAPARARCQHVQDAGNDLPVVLPLGFGMILGHERFDHRPLLIGRARTGPPSPPPGRKTAARNHKTTNSATPWFGPHPAERPEICVFRPLGFNGDGLRNQPGSNASNPDGQNRWTTPPKRTSSQTDSQVRAGRSTASAACWLAEIRRNSKGARSLRRDVDAP